jgi:hypothetical protein
LIKGLVEIIKEKTRKDIGAISKNEAIFVHNLNETLDFHEVATHQLNNYSHIFETQTRLTQFVFVVVVAVVVQALVDIWDYPSERWIEGLPNAPCVLDVYTDRLDRWLELEEKRMRPPRARVACVVSCVVWCAHL